MHPGQGITCTSLLPCDTHSGNSFLQTGYCVAAMPTRSWKREDTCARLGAGPRGFLPSHCQASSSYRCTGKAPGLQTPSPHPGDALQSPALCFATGPCTPAGAAASSGQFCPPVPAPHQNGTAIPLGGFASCLLSAEAVGSVQQPVSCQITFSEANCFYN